MAANTKPVNLSVAAQERGLKLIERDFPPGTAAWAFWSAAVNAGLDAYERGDVDLLGIRAKGAPASARKGSDRALSASRSASEPVSAGVGANGHSEHSEAHGG